MRISIRLFTISACLFTIQLMAFSQRSDAGAIGSIRVSKDVGRNWDFQVEQELRFNQLLSVLDRSLTSLSVDYAIVPKLLKAGLSYDFIYQNKESEFEYRHRGSLLLNAEVKSGLFDFNVRTLIQSTWRDEQRGSYNFNPKYVWRNKIECTYNIFGSPLKPSFSTEIFSPINGAHGFYADAYRLKLGLKYRYSQRQSIDAFIRYDQEIQQANPESLLYLGVGWNYKF